MTKRRKLEVLVSNFFYHIWKGYVSTRKWRWGFTWFWRYKSHAICLRHGRSGPCFNYEWNFWYCRECFPPVAFHYNFMKALEENQAEIKEKT